MVLPRAPLESHRSQSPDCIGYPPGATLLPAFLDRWLLFWRPHARALLCPLVLASGGVCRGRLGAIRSRREHAPKTTSARAPTLSLGTNPSCVWGMTWERPSPFRAPVLPQRHIPDVKRRRPAVLVCLNPGRSGSPSYPPCCPSGRSRPPVHRRTGQSTATCTRLGPRCGR